MEIVKKIISIFNELKINYYVMYGTLISVVRHKGFIPQGDIDVIMSRPDYDKLIELSRHGKMPLNIDMPSNKLGNSTYPFAKFIDNRTKVEEKFVEGIKIGVRTNVRAIDGNFKNNILHMLHHETARFVRKVIEIKRNGFSTGTTKTEQILKGIV